MIIPDLEALSKFAVALSQRLKGGSIIALSGPLGSGKTTLAQMVARALGVKNILTSPTFTLLKSYNLPQPVRGIKRLHHLDLYRLEAIDLLGFEEYFGDSEVVCVVEWAEKLTKPLPPEAIKLDIEIAAGGGRVIQGGQGGGR